ncbi:MAG: large subunit ribosomal protein L19 [Acidimicrobiales bacterium]|jgi:large subunit ribosomal protein L19
MNTVTTGVAVSPVNMEDRKSLGIRAGDTVKVHQRIQDKGKTRIQIFEGLVLARKHGNEPGATFTVRKMASGVGVEKIFPLYSPNIDKIEIVKRSKVRRAKLYFIRDKVAREIKRQMRRMHLVTMTTESEAEAAKRAEEAAVKAVEDEAKAAEEAAKKAEEEKVAAEEKEAEVSVEAEATEEVAEEAPTAEVETPEVVEEKKEEDVEEKTEEAEVAPEVEEEKKD